MATNKRLDLSRHRCGEAERLSVEQRDRECRGLAGAGLGAADHVATFEDRPDRLGLNGGGSGIAGASDGVAHSRREPRISERTEHEKRSLSELPLCVGHPGPSPGPGGSEQGGLLDLPDVGCLKTLRTASHFELDPITFRKTLETLGLNGAVVDEYVLAALLRYKAISFCIVEPLYLSLSHTSNLSLGGLQAPVLPPSWRGYPPELEGKQKRRANWARAACVSISHNRYLTPFVPEPAGRMTCSFEQVNGNILLHEARDRAGGGCCSEPARKRDR